MAICTHPAARALCAALLLAPDVVIFEAGYADLSPGQPPARS